MAKKLPVFGISVGAVSAIVVSILAVNIVSSIIEIDNTNKLIEANSQTPIEYIDESELEENYIPADEDVEDMLLDEDELFAGIDDDDDSIFDTDLAEDNLENDGLE